MQPRLDYVAKAPELMRAVLALNRAVEDSGLEHGLLHLVKLTVAVALINSWNRLSIAFHAIHPVQAA